MIMNIAIVPQMFVWQINAHAARYVSLSLTNSKILPSTCIALRMQCTRRLNCGHFSDFIAQQGDDRWDSGPEEGGLAKSHAARLLSELSGYEKLHGLMVHTGAAQALADRGQELVCSLQLLHCMLEP